jgi:alcohol dehydrogenase (NADP+)
MIESSDFRMTRIPLNHGGGHMPAVGFGTLIPNRIQTRQRFNEVVKTGIPGFIPQGK